jgi:hypothetical protein
MIMNTMADFVTAFWCLIAGLKSENWTNTTLAPKSPFQVSPNPSFAMRTISRPIGSEAVAAGDTTFHT